MRSFFFPPKKLAFHISALLAIFQTHVFADFILLQAYCDEKRMREKKNVLSDAITADYIPLTSLPYVVAMFFLLLPSCQTHYVFFFLQHMTDSLLEKHKFIILPFFFSNHTRLFRRRIVFNRKESFRTF